MLLSVQECSSIRLVQISSNAFIWLQEIQTFCINTSPWESNQWSRCFEEVRNDHVADSIKTIFRNFHRNHRGFTFVVGELYDGTTHLFVKQSKYWQIKNEIEERVDETLPDVAQFRDVTIIKRRISFQGFQSYRDFDNVLREKNLEVERRFVNCCVITCGG